MAAPKTGSDGSAIPLIKAFGHRFSDVVPALVALQCRESFFKQLAGIRTEAEVSLFIDGESIASERGELQLTDYGISGIPVFQVSRFATKALKRKQTVTAQIDFLPKLSEQETEQLFESRFREYAHGKTADEAMVGLLNHKLSDVLLKEAHISLKKPAEEITKKELLQLVKQCKHMEVCVTGSKSFEQAQVCAGGVHTDEINPRTMESNLFQTFILRGKWLTLTVCAAATIYSGHGRAAMWQAYMRQDHTEHISVSGARKNDRGMKLQKCRKIRKKE